MGGSREIDFKPYGTHRILKEKNEGIGQEMLNLSQRNMDQLSIEEVKAIGDFYCLLKETHWLQVALD